MFPYKSVNQSIRIECSIRYLPVLGSITAFNLTWLRLDFEFDFSHLSSQRIRSLSNDDEDGNENVKTSSVSRLFVNLILCRPCMTTTWNCLYNRLEFKSRRICQQSGRIERYGISSIKFEAAWIHFLSGVFGAVAVVLKFPDAGNCIQHLLANPATFQHTSLCGFLSVSVLSISVLLEDICLNLVPKLTQA